MSAPRAVDSLAPILKQNFHRKATRASSYSETKSGGQGEERSMAGGGVSFGFASSKAQRSVGKVVEKLPLDPVGVSN